MMAHQAKIVRVSAVADGILAVVVRCCNDKNTDSVLSLHGLDRANEELTADIQKHILKVQETHANRERAREHIERLLAL